MIGDTPAASTLLPPLEMLATLGYPTLVQKMLGQSSLKDSVKAFQKKNNLSPDGVVGAETAKLLEAAFISVCSTDDVSGGVVTFDPTTGEGLAKCKAVARAKQKKNETRTTIIAAGGGGVLLLVGLALLSKGRRYSAPAVAGYRRRRRR